MLAFQRANPKYGEVGHSVDSLKVGVDGSSVRKEASKGFKDELDTLPGCLHSLLHDCLLKKAKTDVLAKIKKVLLVDPECQKLLKERRRELTRQFDKLSGDGIEAGIAKTTSLENMMQDFFDRNVTKDIIVKPTPEVTGALPPPVKSNLSWLDCKGAFVTCQSGADMETIDFEEFLDCLALCGTVKYENVKGIGGNGGTPGTCPEAGAEMPLEVIVDGIYANFLGEKDAHAVVTEFQQPALPRYDYASSGASPKWITVYAKMDLSHVFGFPTWEKEVFDVLGKHYNEIKLIFQQYAKSGSAGSASAEQLFTMQKTELTNLSLDCGLANEEFTQTRVINVFERANQVCDLIPPLPTHLRISPFMTFAHLFALASRQPGRRHVRRLEGEQECEDWQIGGEGRRWPRAARVHGVPGHALVHARQPQVRPGGQERRVGQRLHPAAHVPRHDAHEEHPRQGEARPGARVARRDHIDVRVPRRPRRQPR